jgi:hypothetical protein
MRELMGNETKHGLFVTEVHKLPDQESYVG